MLSEPQEDAVMQYDTEFLKDLMWLSEGLLSVIEAGRSFMGCLVSALCLTSAAFGSGVAALGESLGAGRGGSSSSLGRMRALISMSEPCSTLALWRLGVRDGTLLLGAECSSGAASGVGAAAGVMGLLFGRLPALLLLLLALPLLTLSPFQLPGLKRRSAAPSSSGAD